MTSLPECERLVSFTSTQIRLLPEKIDGLILKLRDATKAMKICVDFEPLPMWDP